LFLLAILLFVLWSVSAWYLGKNTEQRFKALFDESPDTTEALFDIKLLSFSSSIFSAKAKLAFNLNQTHSISRLVDETEWIFDIDMFNGPVLIDDSGIRFGNALWKASLDHNSAAKLANLHRIKQIKPFTFTENFEQDIAYTLPLSYKQSNVLVKGEIDALSFLNKGLVTSENFTFANTNYQVQAKNLELNFEHALKNNNAYKEIILSGKTPDLSYKHKAFKDKVDLQVAYKGKLALEKGIFNSDNTALIKPSANSDIPLTKSNMRVKVTDLNLDKLLKFVNHTDTRKNLSDQIDVILEEQAELPEGQDQIWQLQDQISQLSNDLPTLISEVIRRESSKKPSIQFSMKHFTSQSHSTVNGELQSIETPIEAIKEHSFGSLTQFKANVNLDDELFKYLSLKHPIKEKSFVLIYKNNKLLMQ